jgi:hypothetical protein
MGFDRLLASTTEIGQKQVAEFVYVCMGFYGQVVVACNVKRHDN